MVQSPAQPLKTALPLVACCSVTTLLSGKSALQDPLDADRDTTQLIPAGVLVTTPDPVEPEPGATVMRCGAAVKPTLTALVTPLTIGTTQVPPVHDPLKPSKVAPFDPPPISVTAVAASKLVLQIPLVLPAVTTQEMPEGELVTAPVPVPVLVIVTMPGGGTR